MSREGPRTGPRHEPERIYERGPDPAEAAERPLASKDVGRGDDADRASGTTGLGRSAER